MSRVNELIEKFKEFKEELNKGVNCSYQTAANDSPKPNATTGTSGGENSMYKQGVAPTADAMAMSESGIKGVHESTNPKMPGRSSMGIMTRLGESGHAKQEVKAKIKEMKSIKPKLPKEVLKCGANGQWSLDKVDPEENVNIPHPQGKVKMANGVNKEESLKDGTNQRLANPPEKALHDGRGKVHMVKEEGTNEKAGTSHPHNKGKFKVESPVKEKSVEHAKAKGLPYNG